MSANDDSLSSLQQKVDLRLTVDLKQMAHDLELRFNDLLEPAPAGIYSHLALEPVMVDGQKYYTKHKVDDLALDFLAEKRAQLGLIESAHWGGSVLVQVLDVNKVKDRAIYDRSGKCIITSSTMKLRERTLSNTPLLPYRGLKIAHLIYRWKLDEAVRHPHTRLNFLARIQEHLVEGAYSNEDLEIFLHPFLLEAGNYTVDLTYKHEWKVFHTQLIGSTLTIDRGVDWRILEWTRQQEELRETAAESLP